MIIIIIIIITIRAEENSSCSLYRHHRLVQGQNTSDVGHLLLACDWGADLKVQRFLKVKTVLLGVGGCKNIENIECKRLKHINVKVIKDMFLHFGTGLAPPCQHPKLGHAWRSSHYLKAGTKVLFRKVEQQQQQDPTREMLCLPKSNK